MAITAQDVNKLRQMTGAGMMDCKKALTEANGDFDAAIDILRKKGQKISAARSDRQTSEGSVFVKTTDDGSEAILVALGCETDFVAKNEDFQKMGEAVVAQAAANKPATTAELLELNVDGRSISEHLTDLMGKIGEKIEVVAYEVLKGDQVVPYIHSNGKLGVLVALAGVNGTDVQEAGKDVAMQIAAMNPVAVDKDQVDASVVEREIEIGKEQARAEGKPEAMLEKIALGKLNKFYKDNTLLNQQFVKDNSKTIAQYLNETHKGLTVSAFKRVNIGG
ncbi:elongation factor Ts [Catalinimonas alkaloidigena]|uniref:Elongation factor Ts n=1 Tax=Catalinimonas alkaloidigena TaxID=1075417 RepID=A0A1G8ZQ19_9BACT|nr:translation elongation factor Ts [Catalinimonas alkaloidigena]SDK16674.1 elongation factor Ts [Catalinimonas alkaloidigena]